jgi:hypothetical protein
MATTPTFVSPFTGTVVTPTQVSYLALSLTANTQLYWPSVVNPTQVVAPRILDVTPTTANLQIALPDATQGAVGTDILIRNYGPDTIVVTDAVGTQTVTMLTGSARYFYLADNTTVAGVYHSIAFGVGTTYNDAAALAGAGLSTAGGQLILTTNAVQVTSPPTITNADRATTYIWNGGAETFNLPDANTLQAGWFIAFRNNGTGTLTIAAQAPSRINSQTTVPVNPGDSGYLMYEQASGNFFTVGLANPTNVTFTTNTYDVDSIIGGTFSLITYAPIIQTYVSLSGTRSTNLLVTFPQITQLYVLDNQTGSTGFDLEFQVDGSSIPPVVVSNGSIVLAFSDGFNLYIISEQASGGQFFASNGTASGPAYAFANDNSSGMFLPGVGELGLSANGIEVININNTNPLAPVVTCNATFIAALISSGTF